MSLLQLLEAMHKDMKRVLREAKQFHVHPHRRASPKGSSSSEYDSPNLGGPRAMPGADRIGVGSFISARAHLVEEPAF